MVEFKVQLTDLEKNKLMKAKLDDKKWRDLSNNDYLTHRVKELMKTEKLVDDFNTAIQKNTQSSLAPLWFENLLMNIQLGYTADGIKWFNWINEEVEKNEAKYMADKDQPKISLEWKEEPSIWQIPKRTGRPGIVVAAGPSIREHDHITMLAKSGWKGPVISTDRMLARLLDAGISPANGFDVYVASVDGHRILIPKMYRDAEGKPLKAEGVTGMFCSTVAPQTVKAAMDAGVKIHWFHGQQDDMYQDGTVTNALNWMFQAPAVAAGGNVGATGWTLALYLQCNPIVFIGLDLGYTPETRIEDTAYFDRFMVPGVTMDQIMPLFKKGFNPDFGVEYMQDPVFVNYKESLLHMIETWEWENKVRKGQPGVYPVTTINATGGGSFHHPSLVKGMHFAEVLEKYGGN